MKTTIQPSTAEKLLNNQTLVDSMTNTASDAELKRLLLEHGLTETQINDLMSPATPIDTSELENVSGGGNSFKLPESISNALTYAKKHPFKTAGRVITTLSAIATPILVAYSNNKLDQRLTTLSGTLTTPAGLAKNDIKEGAENVGKEVEEAAVPPEEDLGTV